MGIFTERSDEWDQDGTAKPRGNTGYASGGFTRDMGFPPGRGFSPAKEETRDATVYLLRGLHNHSGNWVNLCRFEDADEAKKALRRCHSLSQPDTNQAVIKWDHFSAYKIDSTVTITWRRDRP